MDIDEYDDLERTFESCDPREVKKVGIDGEENVKLREEVWSCSLDRKSDGSDHDCYSRSRRGNDSIARDAKMDDQETAKSRKEVRSRSLDHKSDGNNYDCDGHLTRVKYGNESRICGVSRDRQETVKSREEVWSCSSDLKTEGNVCDRECVSKRVKCGNESRIRDANRDHPGTMKSREEVRGRNLDHRSDSDDHDCGGHSKQVKYGNESRIHYSNRNTDSSCHRSLSRYGDKEQRMGSAEHRFRERYRDRHRDMDNTYGRDRERERYSDKARERKRNREHWERRGSDHDSESDRDMDREGRYSSRSGTTSKSFQDRDEAESRRGKDCVVDLARGSDHDGKRNTKVDGKREYSCQSGTPSEGYHYQDETETSRGEEYKQMDNDLIGDTKCSRPEEDGAGLEVDLLSCNRTKDRVDLEADPECDRRTVFAYQISLQADNRDVYEFFSKAGKVRDVRYMMDGNLGMSDGYWCIEFCDTMSVPMAIELSGQYLLGHPVVVKPSESEKNFLQSTTAAAVTKGLTDPDSEGPGTLYVGNLHVKIREDQLRQVFEPFGKVELVRLSMDKNEHCRGFGYVQFARLVDAGYALTLDGNLEIAGRIIKVSAVTNQTKTLDHGIKNADFVHNGDALFFNVNPLEILMQKLDRDAKLSSISDILNMPIVNSLGAPNLGAASIVSAQTLEQNSILAPAVHMGASIQVTAAEIPSIDTIGTPSEFLLLKNMFDPKLETDPDFYLDVKKDVKEECSRFGIVKHVFVEKKSVGFVYIRFDKIKSAISTQHAFHGRWFSGNMVTAIFVDPQSYETKFPRSR